jgi:hypothetical protein
MVDELGKNTEPIWNGGQAHLDHFGAGFEEWVSLRSRAQSQAHTGNA